MKRFNLLDSFRVRLMLLMAALLVGTLTFQYILNLRAEKHSARVVAEQEQALAAGVELGVTSISSRDRLAELRAKGAYPLLSQSAGRVRNILIVRNDWSIYDNLDPAFQPEEENGVTQYKYLKDVPLPRVVSPGEVEDDLFDQIQQSPVFPGQASASAPRAFPFPIQTSDGRWYVIVVLGSANTPASWWNREAFRPLLYMLLILLPATLIAGFLVWRFTRPIKDLSLAARQVAQGNFSVRVPAAERRDEMGELARRFNEMTAKLEGTRELELQLHQAEQSAVVGRLASAIAHEIRNPLNYINLTLDHLRNSFAPAAPDKRETFERLAVQLKAEVARINTRISEFLNYTRPAQAQMEALDIRKQIENALELVEVDAAEHNVKIEVKQEGPLPQLQGDPEKLRSLFTNLFINSMQAMNSDGGELSIRLSANPSPERTIIVEVSDSGRGIAKEDLPKVFEPYFSTKETGTGLGLAIVKKVIEVHGGTIAVESIQGKGTTFKITLPTDRKETGQLTA